MGKLAALLVAAFLVLYAVREPETLEQFREKLTKDSKLRSDVDQWLANNPIPEGWTQDADAYAYTEMPWQKL